LISLVAAIIKNDQKNSRHLPDITTLIHGYNANDIVVDADCFIPLQIFAM
jgi:hypothetical protein